MIPAYWSPTKKLMLLGAMAGGKLVEDTALGNPLTFITDVSKPLKSLLIPFTPVQSGTGDPSPQNIRPILPWNGLAVFGGGKNLANPAEFADDNVWWNGQKLPGYSNNTASGKIHVVPGGTYFLTRNHGLQGFVSYFDKNGDFLRQEQWADNRPRTMSADVYSFGFTMAKGTDAMVSVGNTATAYEPYTPITETDISFPSPVYGGTLDVVSGELWATYKTYTFDGTESWAIGTNVVHTIDDMKTGNNLQGYCNMLQVGTSSGFARFGLNNNKFYIVAGVSYYGLDTEAKAQEFTTGMQIVYPLASPVLIATLTPAQITALVGDNTIWSDADGSMTAVYLKKG